MSILQKKQVPTPAEFYKRIADAEEFSQILLHFILQILIKTPVLCQGTLFTAFTAAHTAFGNGHCMLLCDILYCDKLCFYGDAYVF